MSNWKMSFLIIIFIILHVFIQKRIPAIQYAEAETIPLRNRSLYPDTGSAGIPDSPLTEQYHATNRLAVDFAQIYFPAQQMASLKRELSERNQDPSAKAVKICASGSLSLFDHDLQAGLWPGEVFSTWRSSFNFFPGLIFSFKSLKLEGYTSRYIASGRLLVSYPCWSFMVRTGPVFTLCWGCIHHGHSGIYLRYLPLVILSAFFGFIKWTSLPTSLGGSSAYSRFQDLCRREEKPLFRVERFC